MPCCTSCSLELAFTKMKQIVVNWEHEFRWTKIFKILWIPFKMHSLDQGQLIWRKRVVSIWLALLTAAQHRAPTAATACNE